MTTIEIKMKMYMLYMFSVYVYAQFKQQNILDLKIPHFYQIQNIKVNSKQMMLELRF